MSNTSRITEKVTRFNKKDEEILLEIEKKEIKRLEQAKPEQLRKCIYQETDQLYLKTLVYSSIILMKKLYLKKGKLRSNMKQWNFQVKKLQYFSKNI